MIEIIQLRVWRFAALLVVGFGAGVAVGYTVGSGNRLPLYIIAGVAGLVIVSIAAWYWYYRDSRRNRIVPIDSRESSKVESSAESSLPLFSLPARASPSPH